MWWGLLVFRSLVWFLHEWSCTAPFTWKIVRQDVHVLILWSGSGLENGRWYKAFGFPPDTLRGAMAAVKKRQSMASSTAPAAGGISAVPRSTSQPGNHRGRLISYSHLCGCFWWNWFQFSVLINWWAIEFVLVNYLVLVFCFILLFFPDFTVHNLIVFLQQTWLLSPNWS